MWLILPDEGVSFDTLLHDDDVAELICSGGAACESAFLTVHLTMPKFDVSSDLDLVDGLRALGVTDVFDPLAADFTPTAQDPAGIFLSQAMHAARVAVDEEGCTAAAYTVMMEAGAAMPPEEEVDFILDRPFLFAVTGPHDTPLFIGIVNTPTEV